MGFRLPTAVNSLEMETPIANEKIVEGQKRGRDSLGSEDKMKKEARHFYSELCEKGSVMLDHDIRVNAHFHQHNIQIIV